MNKNDTSGENPLEPDSLNRSESNTASSSPSSGSSDAVSRETDSRDAPETEYQQTIIGVGASAGGLDPLDRMFRKIPSDSGLSFVVVQHLSPDFKSHMDQLLGRATEIPIHVVDDGMLVEPNHIYLIPPSKEMVISNRRLLLTERSKERVLTHPIDQFFRALSQDVGRHAVGVILSGTGSDGSRGITDIAENGGLVITQEPSTCKFDAMPLNAQETGKVHLVLAPEEIGDALRRFAVDGETPTQLREKDLDSIEESGVTRVFQLLLQNHGIDFSHYKAGTVGRRIQRRIDLLGLDSVDQYVERVNEDSGEVSDLYKDLLIGVTRFFRDTEAFERLEQDVLPDLLDKCDGVLRIWVCGCATGEEAYTIAMLVTEAVERHSEKIEFKIFATDAHRGSLNTASVGIYQEDRLADVSQERIDRFFRRRRNGFHVSPELRRSVVFAPQNVVNDPPFTQMHLVTCRNMLIYFQPPAQRKVLSLFHFALRSGGVLFLGPSESVGEISDEFEVVDQHWKIFRKTRDVRLPMEMRMPMLGNMSPVTAVTTSPITGEVPRRQPTAVLPEAYDALLGRFMPASILVNVELEVLHVFEGANQFLEISSGRLTSNLLDMINPQIKTSVAAAIQQATKSGKTVRYGGLTHPVDPDNKQVQLTVESLELPSARQSCTLIQFEEIEKRPPDPQPEDGFIDVNFSELATSRIENLEHELSISSQNLQATIEELETSNEELQATNEEMVAANEELQSTNEELHSVNEELFTVNAEHQVRMAELDDANTDMNNLLASTRVGVLFLDAELYIRRFTPEVARLLHLYDADIGRNVQAAIERVGGNEFMERLERTLLESVEQEWEISIEGSSYFVRMLPYHKAEVTEGVTISFVNVDGLRRAEEDARRFKFMADENIDAQMMVDESGRVSYVNRKMCTNLGYTADELQNSTVMRFDANHSLSDYRDRFDLAHARGGDMFESTHLRKDGTSFPVEISVSPVNFDGQRFLFGIVRDITLRKEREREMTLLTNAVEAASSGIVVTDCLQEDNPITFVNRGFVEMTGFTSDEAVGRNCRFLQGEKTDKDQVATIRRAIDRGESCRVMIRNYRKDGTEFWNDLYLTPVTGDDGKVSHFVGVQSDVTERLAAGELAKSNEQTIRMLLDSTAEGLFGLDIDGRYTFCNESAATALGFTNGDELAGREVHPTVQPTRADGSPFPTNESTILRALKAGEPDHRCDQVFIRSDGSNFSVEFWCHPLKYDNDVIGAVVSFVDITERLAAEQKLMTALDEADAANSAKSQFLANMSHELRTPLSAMLGFTRIVQEEYVDDENLQQRLSVIERNGDYLLKLLGDVLDLSRIEAEKFNTANSQIHLQDLLRDIHSTMQMRCQDYENELTFELANPLPATITSDAARLRQVLFNLIANALKFAPEGHVRVAVEVLQSSEESQSGENVTTLRISVIDDGIGIASDQVKTLFAPFVQANASIRTRFGGTGLGLSISKRLVDAMDGKIKVESKLGEGSTFTVEIPVDPVGKMTELTLTLPGNGPGRTRGQVGATDPTPLELGLNVLIADDMRDVRFVAEHYLRKAGCTVTVAENGQQAVEMVVAAQDLGRPFDLGLIDIQMPVLDGPGFVAELQNLGIEVPTIALTADAMKGTRRRLIGLGFDDYLAKPLDVEKLLRTVCQVVSG